MSKDYRRARLILFESHATISTKRHLIEATGLSESPLTTLSWSTTSTGKTSWQYSRHQ